MGRTWEANADEFKRLTEGEHWIFARLVACSVQPGEGQGAREPRRARDEVRKTSARDFAMRAGTSADRVLRYLAVWDQAAAHGLVPPSSDLAPDDVTTTQLPDGDWDKYKEEAKKTKEASKMNTPVAIAARALTEKINETKGDTEAIIAAHQEKAWRALGYRDWRQYIEKEFDGGIQPEISSHAVIIRLREAGLSNSAIAETLGMGRTTVRIIIGAYKNAGQEPKTHSPFVDPPFVKDMEREIDEPAEEQEDEQEDEFVACKPVVIVPTVRRMPSWYAEKIFLLLADLDEQHYGPDHITAEQLRVLDNLRSALREFAIAFSIDREDATQ